MRPSLYITSLLFLVAAIPAAAQTIPGAVLAKHEPHHHLVYEDSTLRVLRVRVPAHDTTLLHEHDPDYFWIALGASDVVNARPGAPDAVIKSADLSIHYTFGNFAHVARNPGNAPFDNITVELLAKQSNVRNFCEPAVANQPLTCPPTTTAGAPGFLGVSEHPAFASDQLRVSLVTIPPGATMQPRAEVKRSWVIALDTTDVGRGLKVDGLARWVGGTIRAATADWRIRNGAAAPIRVLTVVPISPR